MPATPNPLLGRRRELHRVRTWLEAGERLITICGPAGVGKTRFAVNVAESVSPAFARVGFVDVLSMPDQEQLLGALARSVGIEDAGIGGLAERLGELAADRRLLVVLDSFEQLPNAAPAVGRWLDAAGGLYVVATSPQPLRLSRERVLQLPVLDEQTAMELFCSRALSADPWFVRDPQSEEIVRRICQRLDGLPLALELAAARVRSVPLPDLLGRLDDALGFLGDGHVDLPERHQSLRAAMVWSHRQLDEREAVLLRRLAVFPGTFTAAAATEICARPALDPTAVLWLLSRLVERSLVVLEASSGRHRLLDTVRQFSREQLDLHGEVQQLEANRLEWCVRLTERHWGCFMRGEEPAALEAFDQEAPTLLASLRRAVETGDPGSRGLRAAGLLWRWWDVRGRVGEGRRLLDQLLAFPAPDFERMVGLWVGGHLAVFEGDVALAIERWRTAREMAAALGVNDHLVQILILIGIYGVYSDTSTVDAVVDEGLRASSGNGIELGWLEWVRAGSVASAGRHEEAAASYLRAISFFQAVKHEWSVAHGLRQLSRVRWAQGQFTLAAELQRDALGARIGLADSRGIADSVEVLAWIASGLGAHSVAAELLGAAETQRALAGTAVVGAVAEGHAGTVAACQEALGDVAYLAAIARGRLQEPAQCLAAASRLAEGPESKLTQREVEVLRLVARGWRNRQIAERLSISERTAESHIDHIRTKLQMHTRSEIAAWAAINLSGGTAIRLPRAAAELGAVTRRQRG